MDTNQSIGVGDYPNPPKRQGVTLSPTRAQQHPNNIKCAFYILRGLPGEPLDEAAQEIAATALANGVKTVAILSSEDFLKDDKGRYKFNGYELQNAHRRNYERACMHFMLGTEVVILVNPNVRRSHFYHYATSAGFYYYYIEERIVGDPFNVDAEKIRALHKASASRVPEHIISRYSLEFER